MPITNYGIVNNGLLSSKSLSATSCIHEYITISIYLFLMAGKSCAVQNCLFNNVIS